MILCLFKNCLGAHIGGINSYCDKWTFIKMEKYFKSALHDYNCSSRLEVNSILFMFSLMVEYEIKILPPFWCV
jgi:hypothetical protein